MRQGEKVPTRSTPRPVRWPWRRVGPGQRFSYPVTGFAAFWVAVLAAAVCSSEAIPRPEHPRPDFRREAWVNLNGDWAFCFDPEDVGLDRQWYRPGHAFDRTIRVPFGWESPLSGVGASDGSTIGWYRREIELPEAWEGKRAWLCFGAVDYEADVWVGGQRVGGHEGGYDPFRLEITELVEPGQTATLVVRAVDRTDATLPLGSQDRYSPTSGIWQTVWLEATPMHCVDHLRLTPLHVGDAWTLEVEVAAIGRDAKVPVELRSPRGEFKSRRRTLVIEQGRGSAVLGLTFEQPRVWSPEDPHLYELDVVLGGQAADVVHTYFGLRTFACSRDGRAPPRLLLNERPVALRGAVHHAFYPGGNYTAPDDAWFERDLSLAQRLGLNALRLHRKAVDPRLLYWADRMGVLILADIPGARHQGEKTREAWQSTMRSIIRRDRNHPSLIAWCLFQEGSSPSAEELKPGGAARAWVEEMAKAARTLDARRPIIDRSAERCFSVSTDAVAGALCATSARQINSGLTRLAAVARSIQPPTPQDRTAYRPPAGVPLLITRYSPRCAPCADRDVSWALRGLVTELRRNEHLQGLFFDGLTDVESNHCGLVNYDRSPKHFGYDGFVPDMKVADLQAPAFVGHDLPPVLEVGLSRTLSIPVFVACGATGEKQFDLRWQVRGTDNLGREVATPIRHREVIHRRMHVTFQDPLEVTLPISRPMVGAVAIELYERGGGRVSANYVNVVVPPRRTGSRRQEMLAPTLALFRIRAEDFAAVSCEGSAWDALAGPLIRCDGACTLTYRLKLPEFVRNAAPSRLALLGEMASGSNRARVDWPSAGRLNDSPQTEARRIPSLLTVSLAGTELWPIALSGAPADSRGVLSIGSQRFAFRYGALVRRRADLRRRAELRDRLRNDAVVPLEFRVGDGEHAAGLTLFGEREGGYPIDLALLVETARPMLNPTAVTRETGIAVEPLRKRIRQVAVVQSSTAGGHVWRYRTVQPAKGWAEAGFDDAAWRSGRSAFGRSGDPVVAARTPWSSAAIWLRTEVAVASPPLAMALQYRGDSADIFVDGRLLRHIDRAVVEPRVIPLEPEEARQFVGEGCTLAVHATQSAGSPALDIGLTVIEPIPPTRE